MAATPELYNAVDFIYTAVTQSGPNVTGAGTIQLRVPAPTTAQGFPILFNTSCPIAIGIDANYEVVTPTAVSYDQFGNINITATFTYAHGTGEPVSSASFGLQEAASFAASKGGGLVVLTPAWFGLAGIAVTGKAALLTYLETFHSVSAAVNVLDYSGSTGSGVGTTAATSYTAASGSAYGQGVRIY